MALIVGLDAATATKATVVTSLLIIGVADNLTDSLSMHIYQESERLDERRALQTTTANFATRLAVAISFVCIFLVSSRPVGLYADLLWGFLLLAGLSYLLARARGVSPIAEICKHSAVAATVILVSKVIGASLASLSASWR